MQSSVASSSTELKYRDAVSLYSDSDLSIRNICERTGVGFCAFSAYLSKYHRNLIIKRHNLTEHSKVKLRGRRGQTTEAHYKYKDAIAACDSMEYIEYNISQIARIFEVDCCSLANQLRKHYPEIIPRREIERKKMGIDTHIQYGARWWSTEIYANAAEMLASTDMSIEEVAKECNVSPDGLREHILAYYPHISILRENKRNEASGKKIKGGRNGNWSIHEPSPETAEKYRAAIELYRNTSKTVVEIAEATGVTVGGLRQYIRTWYPDLKSKRCEERKKQVTDPSESSRAQTAKKYAEAVHLFETTPETLKSIAQRLGLTYNSIGGYIRRNHPEAIERHKALID